MNFIMILCYVLYLILCLLLMFVVILIYDFFCKNFLNNTMLHKIQTIVITLTLSATILKFFVELQEKYNLISDYLASIIVIIFLLAILYIIFNYYFKNTAKTQKGKSKNNKRKHN